MVEPKEIGYWSNLKAPNIGTQYGILQKGEKYRVIKAFTDCNNVTHNVGETWIFLAYSFLPYDDGLQWFVTYDGRHEWDIPLWLAQERFQDIERHIEDYVEICSPERT